MNKCIIPTTLVSAVLLSNCAKISDYRNDPSEWGKKKTKRSQTIENSPFPDKPRVKRVVQSKPKSRPSLQPQITAPVNQQIPKVLTPIQPQVSSTPIAPAPSGRITQDFIEPQISGLPNETDLIESEVAPIPKLPKLPIIQNPIIRRDDTPVIPSLPLQDDPNDGLIPPP